MSEHVAATRKEWIGLAVLALPCLLYSMDLTVLDLAVPALSADLHPTGTELLWIMDIYGFVLAGSLITMGTLGDRIGRRRLLLIGASAFGVTSIMAAFSTSAGKLIAARALMGLAGATLAPSTLSLIRSMFHHPAQRSVAIGLWIASYSAGAALGPLAGGLMLERFWWGSVFLIGVPTMLLLLAFGPMLLPEYRDPNPGPLDLPGAALSLTSILSFIYGVKQFAQSGLGLRVAAPIAAGLAMGALFVRRQRASATPLIDLALFRSHRFSVSLAVYSLATSLAFGVYIVILQYLQLVRNLSPLRAGICTIPASLAFTGGSLLTPILARRVRPTSLISAALLLTTAGFAGLAQLGVSSGLAILVGGMAIYSLGLSLAVTLANDAIMGNAPPERAGAAAALSETASELGGALGIALLGSLGTTIYRSAMARTAPAGTAGAAYETLGAAVEAARNLSSPDGIALLKAAREAFSGSFRFTAAAAAILTAALLIVVFWVDRANRRGSSRVQTDGKKRPTDEVVMSIEKAAAAGE
jgi:DHA2 family multidrug resistance protein-like MFS transporter